MLTPDLCFQVQVDKINRLVQITVFSHEFTAAELVMHRLNGTVVCRRLITLSKGVNNLSLSLGRQRKGNFIVRCSSICLNRIYSRIIELE